MIYNYTHNICMHINDPIKSLRVSTRKGTLLVFELFLT